MKNDSSEDQIFAWFDLSFSIDDQTQWIRQYLQFDRIQRTLTFYSNDNIRMMKQAPIVDLNSEMISLSSSATSSSSSSSLCTSTQSQMSQSTTTRSTGNVLKSSHVLQSLSEFVSPSFTKSKYSSSPSNDDKNATLTPMNNSSIHHASFADSVSDRHSPSTSTTTTTTTTINPRQSKTKFSSFFGRSSTNSKTSQIPPSPNVHFDPLKRTKSVTKLERQKRLQQTTTNTNFPQSSPSLQNIPSSRSRSHESLFVVNGGLFLGPLANNSSMSPQLLLDQCHIRRLHPSIFQNTDEHFTSFQYVEIREKNEKKAFYLRSKPSAIDCSTFLHHLRQTSFETMTMIRGLRTDNSLDIWILEAKGLPTKKKYYVKIFLDDDIYGKTTSKERREILFWGENFTFKDLPEGCLKLRCKIFRENERRKAKQNNGNENDLIGFVDIPLNSISGNQFIEQWYPLQIPSGKEKSQRSQDGPFNIRIKSKYQPIDILPIESYARLEDYIRRDYLRLIRILEPHISLRDKDEIATSLTRIAQSLAFSTSFLVDIVQAEIQSTPDNTLTFRGNSIATKSMEAYMKLIGETYLRETLTRFVTDIVSPKTSNEVELEVDPGRVSNLQHLERNQLTLRLLCERIWNEIQQSHLTFPQELKCIFAKLRRLSSSDETMFNLISGSVFLRFLCPAILSPNLFGLTQEYPNEKSSRKLTLIAKTLQTLANFSKFGPKESYMKFMNDFVGKESDNMRRFLANISTIDENSDEFRLFQRNSFDEKCDIDLGREYSILHSTLAELFEQIDLNIRRSLNDFEFVLNELTNLKSFYSSSSNSSLKSPDEKVFRGNLNKENLRQPLSFTNPLFHDENLDSSSSSSSERDEDQQKSLYFVNNLCLETSSSTSRQSLVQQQPLFVLNNGYLTRSTQSLVSSPTNSNSNSTTNRFPPTSTFFCLKTTENPRRQSIVSNQILPPKMGLKALSHSTSNKDLLLSQRSPMLNLYHEEKFRRIECEKQAERLCSHETVV